MAWKPSIRVAVSNSDTSTYWPTPWRWRAIRAPRMALEAIMAVLMSMMAGPERVGSPSGGPVSDMNPVSAWTIGSNPSRSAWGPERP